MAVVRAIPVAVMTSPAGNGSKVPEPPIKRRSDPHCLRSYRSNTQPEEVMRNLTSDELIQVYGAGGCHKKKKGKGNGGCSKSKSKSDCCSKSKSDHCSKSKSKSKSKSC